MKLKGEKIIMKARNKIARLHRKQKVFDAYDVNDKKGRVRPGSVKRV